MRPPRRNTDHNSMLRVLALPFAMLAVLAGLCAAQTDAPAAGIHAVIHNDLSTKPPTPNSNSAAGASLAEDSAAENELLAAANQSRQRAGAPPLRMEESLREAALVHARRMIESGRLDHQFSGESSLLVRIADVSPLNMDRAGENLAYATCAPDVKAALMRSPPHRANLLDRGFNVAGVAAIWSGGRLYVVQDFAHELPSYSARESEKLVGQAVAKMRQQADLPELVQLTPPKLDEAVCSLAKESRPNAHLLATAYDNRRIITYTQSRPDVLPPAAIRLLRDPGVRQLAVGACYARNAAYPTGTYWVAILLY